MNLLQIICILFTVIITFPVSAGHYDNRDWGYIESNGWNYNYRYRGYQCGAPAYRFRNRPNTCENTYSHERQIRACRYAQEQARVYAKYVQGPRGHHDGYLRGISCGTDFGIRSGSADNYARRTGADQVLDSQSEIKSLARDVAVNMANSDAGNLGSERASQQFRNAVSPNVGNIPAFDDKVPPGAIHYSGENNGFTRFSGDRVRSAGEVLADIYFDPYASFVESQRLNRYQRFYIYESDFNYGRRGYSMRDYYLGRNTYYRYRYSERFGRSYSANIINRWVDWARTFDHRVLREYGRFANRLVVVEISTNADGNQIQRNVQIDSPKHVFIDSLRRYYNFEAPLMYARFYNVGLDYGYFEGHDVGEAGGQKIAEDLGRQAEYNRQFKIETAENYAMVFNESYRSAYQDRYEYLKTHSHLQDFSVIRFIDENDNNINEPSERLRLQFIISNSGGVAASVIFSTGAVSSAQQQILSEQQVTIPKLTRQTITTDFIHIAPDAIPIDQANTQVTVPVTLKINDSDQYLTANTTLWIHKVLGLYELERTVNIAKGTVEATVMVNNPRTITSFEDASVYLFANGNEVDVLTVEKFPPATSRYATFQYAVTDPLSLLGTETTIDIQLRIKDIEGEEMILQANNLAKVAINERSGLVDYSLAFGLREASYPGAGENNEDANNNQQAKIIDRIKALNQLDIDRIINILKSHQSAKIGGPDLWSKNAVSENAIFKLLSDRFMSAMDARIETQMKSCRPIRSRSERRECERSRNSVQLNSAKLQASIALLLEQQGCQLKSVSEIENDNLSGRKQRNTYAAIERQYSSHYSRLVKNMLNDTGMEDKKGQRILRKELGITIDNRDRGDLDCDAYLSDWQ